MALTKLDVSGWNVGNVKLFWDMFKNCSALKTIPVDTWTWGDSNHVAENMQSVFSGCSSLTSLDLSKWEMGSATSTQDMFKNCSSLTSINFSGWNTEKVASMANMFENCFALTDINISNWNVGSVSYMDNMFKNCFALKTLDLSGWTLREAGGISVPAMFKMENNQDRSTSLTTIYVGSGWDINKISESKSGDMFGGCAKLVGGEGTTLDLTRVQSGDVVDKTYARIDGGIVYDKNGNKDTTKAGYLTYKKA
jgi:surface protein